MSDCHALTWQVLKENAAECAKGFLRPYFKANKINREEYKAIAKRSVAILLADCPEAKAMGSKEQNRLPNPNLPRNLDA